MQSQPQNQEWHGVREIFGELLFHMTDVGDSDEEMLNLSLSKSALEARVWKERLGADPSRVCVHSFYNDIGVYWPHLRWFIVVHIFVTSSWSWNWWGNSSTLGEGNCYQNTLFLYQYCMITVNERKVFIIGCRQEIFNYLATLHSQHRLISISFQVPIQ